MEVKSTELTGLTASREQEMSLKPLLHGRNIVPLFCLTAPYIAKKHRTSGAVLHPCWRIRLELVYLSLIKSVVHTVRSNFHLWTQKALVCAKKLFKNHTLRRHYVGEAWFSVLKQSQRTDGPFLQQRLQEFCVNGASVGRRGEGDEGVLRRGSRIKEERQRDTAD